MMTLAYSTLAYHKKDASFYRGQGAQGYVDGLKLADNPYPANSIAYQAWLEGYVGQQEMELS